MESHGSPGMVTQAASGSWHAFLLASRICLLAILAVESTDLPPWITWSPSGSTRTSTTSISQPLRSLDDFDNAAPPSRRQDRLGAANDENRGRAQSDSPSECIPYTIKWTLSQKKTRLNKLTENTEQNVDCYPSVFWETTLKSGIDEIVTEKQLTRTHEPDETKVTVSINARGEEDIFKRFSGLDINWTEVDEQIDHWSALVRSGRKLTLRISFTYRETCRLTSAPGRGKKSATNGQLRERATIHNGQNATDEPPIWEQVYTLFECPGTGCDAGPYCWHNPATGRHHAISTSVLLKMVEYAKKGGRIEQHADVPKHFQNEILNPPSNNKRKQPDGPQINITNIMPGAETLPPPKRIKISGHRDKAVQRYRDWHCHKVSDESWKQEFHKIAEHTLKERFTVNWIFKAQKEARDLFISHNISRGIVDQWVSMVDKWVAEIEQA